MCQIQRWSFCHARWTDSCLAGQTNTILYINPYVTHMDQKLTDTHTNRHTNTHTYTHNHYPNLRSYLICSRCWTSSQQYRSPQCQQSPAPAPSHQILTPTGCPAPVTNNVRHCLWAWCTSMSDRDEMEGYVCVVCKCGMYFEGSWPEWYISTIKHVWDIPFWSGTLHFFQAVTSISDSGFLWSVF